MSRTWVILLVSLAVLQAEAIRPVGAQSEVAKSSVFAQELRRPDGTAYFLGAAAIESLLQEDYESLGAGPGVLTSEQLAHELVGDLIARSNKAQELNEEDCVQTRFFAHRELRYIRPPEDFEDPEDVNHQTVFDLAIKAPEAAVVRVVEANSGLFGVELGTLVHMEVQEWIKKSPEFEVTQDPRYFFTSGVWLEVVGKEYCQTRNGLKRLEPGDRFLVLGFRSPVVDSYFDAGNVFPLDGEVILPQPYPLMESPLSVSLSQLRSNID